MRRLWIIGLGLGVGMGQDFSKLLCSYGATSSCVVVACYLPEGIQKTLLESGHRIIFLEELAKNQLESTLAGFRKAMAAKVLGFVGDEGGIVCLFPGRPWPGGALYQELLVQTGGGGWQVDIFPGEDLHNPLLEFLRESNPGMSLSRGVTWIDILNLGELLEAPRGELLLTGAGDRHVIQLAREMLKPLYPPDHMIDILCLNDEGVLYRSSGISLQDLGKPDGVPASWTILRLPPRPYYYLGDMVQMLRELRAPHGCPWDREQDHLSLRPYLLEETYEVLDAIDSGDHLALCEELGDLLLQIVFHSRLAAEKDAFYFWQVVDGISRKIYRRHPHVFQNEKARDAREVGIIWQKVKDREKGGIKKDRFALPRGFPALFRAQKIQRKAAQLGFDWPDRQGAVAKLFEELGELSQALESGRQENIDEEMGDLFFSLVNVARFVGVEAELVLDSAVEKFIRRFRYVDEQVQKRGGDYGNFTLRELDVWWDEAKKQEKPK